MFVFPLYGEPLEQLEKFRDAASAAYVNANGAFLLAREVGLDIHNANKDIANPPENIISLDLFNLLNTGHYPKLTSTVYCALGNHDPRDCSSVDEFGKFILAFPDLLELADTVIIFGSYYYDDYDGTTIIVEHGNDRFEYDGILTETDQTVAINEFESTALYTQTIITICAL